MKIYKTWTELKTLLPQKEVLQYKETTIKYIPYYVDEAVVYYTELWIDTSKVKGIDIAQNNTDKTDFENNYKSGANAKLAPRTNDGKHIVQAEAKPVGTSTCFCGQADNTGIGDGKELCWDFANSDDELLMPSGSTQKCKRLEFSFIDSVYIKEGSIHYQDAKKGSYIDLYVVCPTGQYYLDGNGVPTQATEDTPIAHYGMHYQIKGSTSDGDKIVTDTVSNAIPSTYKFWIDITVPDTDSTSYGHINLELYRVRTVIL